MGARITALGGCLLGFSLAAGAQGTGGLSATELVELPLEQLMQMDVIVSSVVKRDQILADTAAGVFVITAEDIRRSGVSSIPEALRMAPGMHVARISANEWAVSARGFGSRYSKFQLILIDGRSVYDPLFGGVNWDEQNLVPENIERIEVIRGPAGSVWGSNAVNGVVNIITKNAGHRQGLVVSAAGGNGLERSSGVISYGSTLGRGHYQLSVRQTAHGRTDGILAQDDNPWRDQRLSFSYDSDLEKGDFSLDMALVEVTTETVWPVIDFDRYTTVAAEPTETKSGGFVQMRWNRTLGENTRISMRSSYDRMSRDSDLFEWNSDNLDVDVELDYLGLASHHLSLGLNTRFSDSEFVNKGQFSLSLLPEQDRLDNYSLFFQDQIGLSDNLKMIVGARYDDNELGGTAFQPTLRMIWAKSERHRFWMAVSGAQATLSRFESENLRVNTDILAPGVAGPLPSLLVLTNDGRSLKNTELVAYELGYRFNSQSRFEADVTLYRHSYDNLLDAGEMSAPQLITINAEPFLEYDLVAGDSADGNLLGAELSAGWRAAPTIYLQYSGSYTHSEIDNQSSVFEDAPRWQHSLRSLWNLRHNLSLDSWLTYTDALPRDRIDAFASLNIRLGWQINPQLRLSLNGKNLIDADRVEYRRDALPPNDQKIPDYWYLKIEWAPGI